MPFSVNFYCPDTNLKMSGDAPRLRGLGGGKTGLAKMAEALGRLGHRVRVYAHCTEGTYGNVEYAEMDRIAGTSCDILVAITGHKGDISDLYRAGLSARLKILWLSGAGFIRGIDDSFFDWYYANSVFMRKRAVKEWHLPMEKVMATHQGYDPDDFPSVSMLNTERDAFGIIFASHPSKGFERVVEIVGRLRREVSERFFVDVYGGYGLWDDADGRVPQTDGEWLRYRGMVSQPDLCDSLTRYSFMLHLTDYEDTSSIIIHQAKRAGVVVIASQVGGNGEIMRNGYDGFLISDHYRNDECYRKVRSVVSHVVHDKRYADYLRSNAAAHASTWERTALSWGSHWDGLLNGKKQTRVVLSPYTGYRNLGDEAVLSCLVEDVRSQKSDVVITAVSGDPFYTEALHGVPAVAKDDYRLQAQEVARADYVVLGGGGMFQDYGGIRVSRFFQDHSAGVTAFATIPLMARIYRKPLVYYAHGVGPLFSRESALFSRWAFEMADAISVRDGYSRDLLTEVLEIDAKKVALSCDPVLRVPPPPAERARALMLFNGVPRDKRLICVSVRYWLDKTVERKVVREVSRALAALLHVQRDYHVVLIPFQLPNELEAEDDRVVCEEMSSRLPLGESTVVGDYTTHEEVAALYSLAEFSVGMRYHSLVLSAITGTPMIALSYDKKDDELMRDLGFDDLSIDVRNITCEALLLNLEKVVQDLPALRAKVQDRVARILVERGDTGAVLRL